VRGATQFEESGVFMIFEENAREPTDNGRSLGFDLDQLVAQKKIVLDHVRTERREIERTGDYDVGELFIRLGPLFAGLPNHALLRGRAKKWVVA
jgi:circadian clock protein KaiC